MFIDKDSIIINNINMSKYLTQATYGFNKLWGEDSGRNLRGDMIATLVGIFPKLELQFKPLNKEEIELLIPILDSEFQNVSYYDPNKKRQITMKTYTGDYQLVYTNNRTCKGFSCSFISTKRRG